MSPQDLPEQPSLLWRTGSTLVTGLTGLVSRSFLYGANRTAVVGLDDFLAVLDRRADLGKRQKGLITGEKPTVVSPTRADADRAYSIQPHQRVSK